MSSAKTRSRNWQPTADILRSPVNTILSSPPSGPSPHRSPQTRRSSYCPSCFFFVIPCETFINEEHSPPPKVLKVCIMLAYIHFPLGEAFYEIREPLLLPRGNDRGPAGF